MKLDYTLLKSIVSSDCEFKGNKTMEFTGLQSAYECEESHITWIKPGVRSEADLLNSVPASCIICSPQSYTLFTGDPSSKLFLIHKDPKQIFFSISQYIYKSNLPVIENLVHPTAIIDPKATIGNNVSVGAYTVIGACNIGDNTQISDHVKIYDCVSIGKNCVIREFCSIGGEGFGFIKTPEGKNEHIPHIGSVVIEDNVSVYPFSNIDRGTLGKTLVQENAVIDHYVHIGHNTRTGMNTIIAAGTVLAGGSQIKNNCFIGVNTVLKEKCIIGSNVLTGMGSVVVKDIPDGEIWVGNPAKFLKENKQ